MLKTAAKALLPVALAFWAIHITLRVLLLFRNDPYGMPFVNKPDWYIFHAIALDYMWIAVSFAAAVILTLCVKRYGKIIFIVFHVLILLLTYTDHETQRFLGSHVSFSLIDTYKDPSSIGIFWDYFAYDQSVPFLQAAVLLLMFPSVYFLNKLFSKWLGKKTSLRNFYIGGAAFYLCCWLFLNVIWTGSFRLKKLTPAVNLIHREIINIVRKAPSENLTDEEIQEYQKFRKEVLATSHSPLATSQKANFIVVFLESHRYIDVKKSSPFLCSLMNAGLSFSRMHVSGLPTVGGLLSSLTGVPTHSTKTQVTDLPFINLPSFASYMRSAGWRADFFSAADPAWDNLGVWMAKWYDMQHYSREREDDSLFWDWASSFVKDSLANKDKPFLATMITRSNHYPFNFASNMPQEEKDKSIQERMLYTMNYADRQLARFVRSIQNEPWFENTYLIVLADHGFPLGENGNSAISGGAYYSSTHIPFVITGKGIEQKTDTISASQIDIAPTILDLAGIKASNPFMGQSLLGERKNFALGTHYGYKTLNFDNYRLIFKEGEESLLYENSDSLQARNVSKENRELVFEMEKLANKLIKISDFALENDKVVQVLLYTPAPSPH
ncbi:MAG: sulfatase-like hydrolase/transferase [Fibromonadales bacterium]|nr:sulfatase-like hydrolase/transferase [Fibromonadales bacterium]